MKYQIVIFFHSTGQFTRESETLPTTVWFSALLNDEDVKSITVEQIR